MALTREMIVMLLTGVLLSIIVTLTDDRPATLERAGSATIEVLWNAVVR